MQHLYMNEALREQVFTLLENEMAPGVDKHNKWRSGAVDHYLVYCIIRIAAVNMQAGNTAST